MKQELEKFLNDNTQTEIELSNPFRTINLYKEKFDERFVVIQLKPKTKFLKQEGYDVAGYYDTNEKKMYEVSRAFEEFINKVDNVKIASYNEVEKELIKKVDDLVNEYVLSHAKKLKKEAEEKYNYEADWIEPNLKSTACKLFITSDNFNVPINIKYASNIISKESDYYTYNVYYKYLTDPNKTIEYFKNKVLEIYSKTIGMELLKKETTEKYLKEIDANKDDGYKEIYLNKKILNSIKNIYAKTLSITIEYNNNKMTFKYDYDELKSDLECGARSSSSFGSNYLKVSQFIKDNNPSADERYRCAFDFNKITSITYGKNELYSRDEINFEKENDNDEIELEM